MSEFYQPGQHPDADQLNAFAEDALPAHEREQTLAHLAGCADCRTIVSLALPPVDEVPQAQPVAERRPWFSWLYGWNVAWLAGAGLAALIFLTVHVRNSGRNVPTAAGVPTQTAEVLPVPPPPVPAMAPAIAPPMTNAAPPPAMKAVPPPPPPPPVANSVEALRSPAVGTAVNNQQIANLPITGRKFLVQPPPQQLTQGQSQQLQTQQQNSALHGSVFGAGAGNAVGGPLARGNQSPLAQRYRLNESDKDIALAAPAAPAPAPPAPPVIDAQVPPAPAGAAKLVPQTSDAIAVNAGGMEMGTMNSSVSTMALTSNGLASMQRLPSHLGTMSTTMRGSQMLALDTAGTLFLSTDGGRHWKKVAAQWPGRAVKVELASLAVPAKQPSNLLLDGADSGPALSTLTTKSLSGASVAGVVNDTSGAVIPGASLKITDARTGVVRTATSDRNGHYAVSGLTPDAYQIDTSAPGFEAQHTIITLAAAQQSVVNVSFKAGATSATAEVSEAAPMMDTTDEKRKLKAAKAAPLSDRPAVFEITTDGGEIWTSADGKSWKRK